MLSVRNSIGFTKHSLALCEHTKNKHIAYCMLRTLNARITRIYQEGNVHLLRMVSPPVLQRNGIANQRSTSIKCASMHKRARSPHPTPLSATRRGLTECILHQQPTHTSHTLNYTHNTHAQIEMRWCLKAVFTRARRARMRLMANCNARVFYVQFVLGGGVRAKKANDQPRSGLAGPIRNERVSAQREFAQYMYIYLYIKHAADYVAPNAT